MNATNLKWAVTCLCGFVAGQIFWLNAMLIMDNKPYVAVGLITIAACWTWFAFTEYQQIKDPPPTPPEDCPRDEACEEEK